MCGGEKFPKDLVSPLLERGGEVWNLYGPTETTIWSTAHRVEAVDGRSVPIGRPIANTTVYVMDTLGRLTPQGVPGELWIGGDGVARGYLDRPDLTTDRFVTSPFDDGRPLYRTGDLVRWRNDGVLEHLGRLDAQVKVRGHRIELGEIEAVLADHEDVREAVAAVRGAGSEARLIASVVREPGRMIIGSQLRRYLREKLPDYMVPGLITTIDTVPRTPNGKVDRRALDVLSTAVTPRDYVAPRTEAEAQLAQVWMELLEVDRVGVHDNFFELGGHSLLAMRAVALASKRFAVDIEPRGLFFQTLEQTAASGKEVTSGHT